MKLVKSFAALILIGLLSTSSAFATSQGSENPYQEFKNRFQRALNNKTIPPEDAVLATIGTNGLPTARIITIRKVDQQNGIVFYTSPNSSKVGHLEKNPNVALLFYWPNGSQPQQVIIRGMAKPLQEKLTYKDKNGKSIDWQAYQITPNYFEFSDVDQGKQISEQKMISYQLNGNNWSISTKEYLIPQFFDKKQTKKICHRTLECAPDQQ